MINHDLRSKLWDQLLDQLVKTRPLPNSNLLSDFDTSSLDDLAFLIDLALSNQLR